MNFPKCTDTKAFRGNHLWTLIGAVGNSHITKMKCLYCDAIIFREHGERISKEEAALKVLVS